MTLRGLSKADRYVTLLDAVRCQGNWQEVPAIAIKIEQYAPERRCLIQAAYAECQLLPLGGNHLSLSPEELRLLLAALETVVSSEQQYEDDILQAKVCMGWIHWYLDEYDSVVALLNPELLKPYINPENRAGGPGLGWSNISAVQGTFLIAQSQEATSHASQALEIYASTFPLVPETVLSAGEAELGRWMEKVLDSYCLLASNAALSVQQPNAVTEALLGFRLWARLEDTLTSSASLRAGESSSAPSKGRRQMWMLYYSILSTIIQRRLPYHLHNTYPIPNSSPDFVSKPYGQRPVEGDVEGQQTAELTLVQIAYERLLLQQVPFPSAHQFNEEVEKWIEMVVGNWQILSRNPWYERSLQPDGKPSFGREVVDILYRAAAKSFHSTSILRYLFILHTSLAELDLAFNALNTYVDLVQKGKARIKMSGRPEPGLDEDSVALRTASEGVRILCLYGGRRGVKRAEAVVQVLEDWVRDVVASMKDAGSVHGDGHAAQAQTKLQLSLNRAVALAYHAIGICHGYSAKWTTDASHRPHISSAAVSCVRKALGVSDVDEPTKRNSLYTLGKLLAESRELDAGVAVVRRAIAPFAHGPLHIALGFPDKSLDTTIFGESNHSVAQPSGTTLPLWHLLVLLLSAQEEYDLGLCICEAVMVYFLDPTLDDDVNSRGDEPTIQETDSVNGPSSSSSSKPDERSPVGHFTMEDLESLLQLKMTHLALVEVTEGVEAAINASSDLLVLYHRLFGDPSDLRDGTRSIFSTKLQVPKSSGGTMRSFRGSVLSRPKSTRRLLRRSKAPRSSTNVQSTASMSQPLQSLQQDQHVLEAPVIQITEETKPHDADGAAERRNARPSSASVFHRFRKRHSIHRAKSADNLNHQSATADSHTPRVSRTSRLRSSVDEGHEGQALPVGPTATANESQAPIQNEDDVGPATRRHPHRASQIGVALSHDEVLPGIASNAPLAPLEDEMDGSPSVSDGISHGNETYQTASETRDSLEGDHQRAHRHEIQGRSPWLSETKKRCLRTNLLVRSWLLIAGLYRRAALFDDGKGAVDEADKLMALWDAEWTLEDDRNGTVDGWDTPTSAQIDRLWGDVLAERGHLALAQTYPHEALAQFGAALSRCANHPGATVGLCNILLDIASSQIPARSHEAESAGTADESWTGSSEITLPDKSQESDKRGDPTLELERLAARDRAYGLLSSLTKLDEGWDNSDAWLALARAYEQSGQAEKARELLWWCLELEDGRPIRHWRNAGTHAYAL